MPSTTFVDLSRFQFARTAAFDMTFPALSVGLSIFLVICCRGHVVCVTGVRHRSGAGGGSRCSSKADGTSRAASTSVCSPITVPSEVAYTDLT
jgi:hypothetical protein